MKNKALTLLALFLSFAYFPAFADGLLPPTAPQQPAQVTASVTNKKITLDAGVRIPITVYNTVSSDNVKAGDMISISINDNVKVNGVVLFKKGSTGILNVSKSIKSGGHGRAGELEINGGRVNDVFGNPHPISASLSSKGSSKRGWAIVSTILGILVILVPFGLWVDGSPATVQGGQYLDAITTSTSEIEIPAEQAVGSNN